MCLVGNRLLVADARKHQNINLADLWMYAMVRDEWFCCCLQTFSGIHLNLFQQKVLDSFTKVLPQSLGSHRQGTFQAHTGRICTSKIIRIMMADCNNVG
jgi:hypothetical protein